MQDQGSVYASLTLNPHPICVGTELQVNRAEKLSQSKLSGQPLISAQQLMEWNSEQSVRVSLATEALSYLWPTADVIPTTTHTHTHSLSLS